MLIINEEQQIIVHIIKQTKEIKPYYQSKKDFNYFKN